MRYRWMALGLAVAIVVAESTSLISQWFYKQFVDGLVAFQAGNVHDLSGIWHALILILSLHALGWAAWRVAGFLAAAFQPRLMGDLEQTAFRYLMGHSYQFFTDMFAGALVRRVGRFSRAYGDVAEAVQWRLFPLLVSVICILSLITVRSPWIGGAVFLWILVFIGLNFYSIRHKLKVDIARAAKDSEVTGALADIITNSSNVKLFTGFEREDTFFGRLIEERRVLHSRSWRIGESNAVVQSLLMLGIEAAVLFGSIHFWQRGLLTVGDFVLFQVYLGSLFNKLFDLHRILRQLYEAFADAKEMVDILDTPHGVQDLPKAKPLVVTKGAVTFQNVSFTYQKTRQVLRGFDLSVAPTEKVALVGPSGAGKSTIVKLLFRLYDIDRGRILIDGQSIARVTQESLCAQIAMVPQEPILFHRTLRDNIRYGRADGSDEEVVAAAKKAHCHEFIENLPLGYDTFVGERGVKLSGGERQRVAIARAILKRAPILVLDEATSSLDSESEGLIQDALRQLMKDKTVLVIAHRLSTIMQMDRIVVMEEGRVVDTGTHAQLLRQEGGLYKKLWDLQAGGFLVRN